MTNPVEHSLELTVSALKEGVNDLGLNGGVLEIQRWEEQLSDAQEPALQEVGGLLAELRGELETDAPNQAAARDLLRRLGDATLSLAGNQGEGDLQRSLRELGNLLVREAQTA